ncbi:hypothetical protein N1031_01945 [Herbiconiux moechotypicola]|uniref:Uncharacterized protein n=1 Tax=Herbiconiux moechotypicola TaxID=637393 RepID=A0ABN3D6X6_9MICO|nr:hypothetical protein [Herbiconiux moechotypicola]MCS5728514.1 hypothetical protein [Herbiconiux moechotypicola]
MQSTSSARTRDSTTESVVHGHLVHYGELTIAVDATQAALLAARITELCRRRRTALHTVYGVVAGSRERAPLSLVVGHGVPTAVVASDGVDDDELAREIAGFGLSGD